MTRAAYLCEDPRHVGHPLVGQLELLEERTEYRAIRDQSRWHTHTNRRVCKTCARRTIEGESNQVEML